MTVTEGRKLPAPDPASIRLAAPADVPRLVGIRAAVRENRLSDPASVVAADYAPYIADGCCWVWAPDGEPAGFAALDSASATVWALFVAPEAEGQGGGRALLEHLTAEARRRGLADLRLTTEPAAAPSASTGRRDGRRAVRRPEAASSCGCGFRRRPSVGWGHVLFGLKSTCPLFHRCASSWVGARPLETLTFTIRPVLAERVT